MKGKFIVLDGGEGCGKSTIVEYLKTLLPQETVFTREPGGSPFAEAIRNLMLNNELSGQADGFTQHGLIWASRADHLKNKVRPALEKGIHVITDRFDSSTWAYQIHGQECLYLKDIFPEIRKLYVQDTEPDVYIFLDVPPEIGMQRVANRKGDSNHFDERKIDFHTRIREAYLNFPNESKIIIDTNKPLEEVKEEVKNIVLNIINN